MFVRVDRRTSPNQKFGVRLVFHLARSERREGRVRQVRLAYLGTIQERRAAYVFPRLDLWKTLEAALERLDLADDERERIRAQIEPFAARPTAEDRLAEEQAVRAAESRIVSR